MCKLSVFWIMLRLFRVSTSHKQLSYDIKQRQVLPQQLHSSRRQLPWLKAWIGLSVQTWRSSTGPQAAIIRLAAADNCHQTKQDREILPLSAQLLSFSHPPLHNTFLQQAEYSPRLHTQMTSLGQSSSLTQNVDNKVTELVLKFN